MKKLQKTGKWQKIAEKDMINREYYLKQLVERKHSSKIKIVTSLKLIKDAICGDIDYNYFNNDN